MCVYIYSELVPLQSASVICPSTVFQRPGVAVATAMIGCLQWIMECWLTSLAMSFGMHGQGVRSNTAALTMAQSTLTWQVTAMVNANYDEAKFAST